MKKFRFLALVATVCALAFSFSSCGGDDEPKKDPQVENPTEKPKVINLDGKMFRSDPVNVQYDDQYDVDYAMHANFTAKEVEITFASDDGDGGNTRHYNYTYEVNPKTFAIKLSLRSNATDREKALLQKVKALEINAALTRLTYNGNDPLRAQDMEVNQMEVTYLLKLKK